MTCFTGQSRTHQKHKVLRGVGAPEEGLLLTHISVGPPDVPPGITHIVQLYGSARQPSPLFPAPSYRHHPEKAKGRWGGEGERVPSECGKPYSFPQ